MDYSVSRFFKIILLLILLAGILWLTVELSSLITILIISLLIAYILDPLASFLEYKGLSRTQATLIIFVVITLLFAVAVAFVIPPMITEIKTIEQNIGSGSSAAYIQKIQTWIQVHIPFLADQKLDLGAKAKEMAGQLAQSFFSIIGSVVSVVTTVIIIPFAVFFLLKDGPRMKKNFVSIIPNRYFEMSLNLIHKTDQQLGGYLRGQFIDAMIIGLLSIFALWLLHVPYFILIGVFAGLANMIPYVGPLTGAVSGIVVVLLNGGNGQQVLLVASAFAVIQLTDNVLVQPIVVAKNVDLHPLIIIFAVIIGGQFFGILGMLLAVPAVATINVISVELYRSIRKYTFSE